MRAELGLPSVKGSSIPCPSFIESLNQTNSSRFGSKKETRGIEI